MSLGHVEFGVAGLEIEIEDGSLELVLLPPSPPLLEPELVLLNKLLL